MNTSRPTTLTRKYIITERPSTTQPNSKERLEPMRPISMTLSVTTGETMFWMNRVTAQMQLMARAATAISPPLLGSFLPKARMAPNARKGRISMIHAVSTKNPPSVAKCASAASSKLIATPPGTWYLVLGTWKTPSTQYSVPSTASAASPSLPPHQCQFVGVGGLPVAEDHEDDRQADADLGGGHGDHEDGEDLAQQLAGGEHRLEGDQVDVDRGEHELDRQQHEHQVASHEQAVHPEREQGGSEDDELDDRHVRQPPSALPRVVSGRGERW